MGSDPSNRLPDAGPKCFLGNTENLLAPLLVAVAQNGSLRIKALNS